MREHQRPGLVSLDESPLVWIDLEMTGLFPEHDLILEIATVITDFKLNIIAQGPSLVIHQPDTVLDAMHPWPKEQHTKSGLLSHVKESKVTLEQAYQETQAFVTKHCSPQDGLLAGNSVWQDRIFLRRYMPNLVSYLHYRIIDVTTIKELVCAWYPKSEHALFKKGDTHRAHEDILESINELRHYRKHFFVGCDPL